MWLKLSIAALFVALVCCAAHFQPSRERTLMGAKQPPAAAAHVRLLTWNIGYAELEPDTRAHTEDLPAVADVILRYEPDAVALQELTGAAQLNTLLGLLHGRYKGAAARPGTGDRCEAVLVKDSAARFEQIAANGRYALGADFHARSDLPELLLVSAHTDAFSAARRRAYTEELVDWAHARQSSARVFIAGDFNFELRAGNESNLYTDNLKHDSESYSYLLRYFRDLGRAAGPTAINDRRIDYVFGPVESISVSHAEVLSAAAVGRMDHWPLLLEVDLR